MVRSLQDQEHNECAHAIQAGRTGFQGRVAGATVLAITAPMARNVSKDVLQEDPTNLLVWHEQALIRTRGGIIDAEG